MHIVADSIVILVISRKNTCKKYTYRGTSMPKTFSKSVTKKIWNWRMPSTLLY